ncbi:nucleoside-diphosphate kinase [Candidatus Woesearchaeota archaeon CG10_big_fil_rev_8_21_14_0_10_45_5]|nr:MAG: nucleoside-diphosphate kinase [Candidatus Woesearchaeota archaeon CG10_big_fil_rev_8_21_14_0_10_45_5]PIU30412.1 MAG: nucleoside-diphosphate kinase [Candidatus Woesearchaeota archaeon CG07_land_8_20_14_0_80_44_23]
MAEDNKPKPRELNADFFVEKTLVLIKPDAVQRGLTGRIIERFDNVGLKIVGIKMVQADKELAMKHYPKSMTEILGDKTMKEWQEMGIATNLTNIQLGEQAWNDLIAFATEAPVIAMVFEGVHAVEIVRKMCGSTSPHKSPPGTIRGDFSPISMGYASRRGFGGRNIIHASGSKKEAEAEIMLWFKPNEIYNYSTVWESQVK